MWDFGFYNFFSKTTQNKKYKFIKAINFKLVVCLSIFCIVVSFRSPENISQTAESLLRLYLQMCHIALAVKAGWTLHKFQNEGSVLVSLNEYFIEVGSQNIHICVAHAWFCYLRSVFLLHTFDYKCLTWSSWALTSFPSLGTEALL